MAHAHEVIFDDLVESLGRRGPGDMIFRDGSESEQFARFDLSVERPRRWPSRANACARTRALRATRRRKSLTPR